jgi:PAS domain S-box-containing protein
MEPASSNQQEREPVAATAPQEEELRRREALLAEVQEIARLGSWEWDIKSDHVTWSPEFYDMLGADEGDVEPTVAGFLATIHPEDRPAAEHALERALEGGDNYAMAHRLVAPDGAVRMMICRGRVFRDDEGAPERMVGVSLDFSDYMDIADDLRDRHDQLLTAEDVAGTGSFEWDIAGDRVTWSAGMYPVFGLAPGEFGGTLADYIELVHPDDRDARQLDLERLLDHGEVLETEHRIRHDAGEVRWISSRIKLVRSPSGEPRSVVGVCRDVTGQRQT